MLVLLLMAVTGTWAADINLSKVSTATTAQNGDVLTGTLANKVQISIADGARVTLDNVSINASGTWTSGYYAGITCLGDATIVLVGENTVKGFHQYYPGIHVAKGYTLTIRGDGSLTASSNDVMDNGAGAGIGAGWGVDCGNIIIEDGIIIVTGGTSSAGIGGSSNGSCGNISITGGNITAKGGGDGAGIGGGIDGSCGNIFIMGGTIDATGGSNAAAIGSGTNSLCGNITITNGVTSVTAIKYNLAKYSIGNGNSGTCGTITIGGINKSSISESPYTYFNLADSKDNSSTLTTYNDNKKKVDVTLKRTLQTSGWNTFCAPFSIAKPSGWTLKKLTGSSFDNSTGILTLNFEDASSIEVGKPYLVRVAANVENPTFESVIITNGTTTTETTNADFVPVMNPTSLTSGNKKVLFVTGGNKLTYPSTTGNINGFRAYFYLKGDAAKARAFSMSFDDEGTGITEIYDLQTYDLRFDSDGIYTLDGRRIEGQPTAKGMYIQNGRKVIVK